MRVIALGLDATPRVRIDAAIAAGALPNLARLRARSATADLVSREPYRAEYPWTEFTTGRTSETLGYWSTVDFDPAEYVAFMRGAADADPFYAFGDDTTVVAFDLPKVVQPDGLPGAQVLGWGAHSPQHPLGSRPDGLLDQIRSRFGPHPGLAIEYAGGWHQPDYLTRAGSAQGAGARTRADVVRWLVDRCPDWDLVLTLFGETHQIGHMTGHGDGGLLAAAPSAPMARSAYAEVLRGIDDAIGVIASWAPSDAALVVFSAHGMGPADDDTAASLAPEILLRAALGEARRPVIDLAAWCRRGAPPVVPRPWESLGARTRSDFGPRPARRGPDARAWLRSALWAGAPALMRARRQRIDRRGPLTPPEGADHGKLPFHDRTMDEWHPAAWYRDAWPRLPAFVVPSYSDAHVRINLAGRERHGVVDRGDYARACRDVERLLRACRDGRTGAPAVVDVVPMRRDDPFAPDGPGADLVVHMAPTDALEHPDVGAVGPGVALRTGSHRADGFAYVAAPGIVPGARGRHRVADLSATICSLLGRAPRARLDGASILDRAAMR